MLYIAYTREDALFAVQLTQELSELAIEVWLDLQEISLDAQWHTAQSAAIEASEGLIVVLSPEAMQREHMQREIQQAFMAGKQVCLAVARRSPWQDWLNGLPVADFTQDYETGLAELVLNIMGDQRLPDDTSADEAELWLRQAGATTNQPAPPPQQTGQKKKKPRRSLLKRFRR
ncbi:toll/interleukin-1 receptor domain-containing protein [Chloroflexota bacterium]